MKEVITTNPFFGITISIIGYAIGLKLYKKTKMAIFNPLLIAIVFVLLVLFIFAIPLESYERGGDMIKMFLTPATCVLAVTIYRERKTIMKNLFPILIGTFSGSVASLIYIYFMSKLLGIDDLMMLSIAPKGITSPMALALSESIDAMQGLTMLSVLVTGIFGNMSAYFMVSLFRVKNPISRGVAIGTSSHVVGTAKAMEMGEEEGSIAGVSLIFTGIMTTIIILLFLS